MRVATLLASLLVVVGCSGSRPSESSPSKAPKPEFDLPDDQNELRTLLKSAEPQKRIAIKGKLRRLEKNAALSFDRPAIIGASLSAGFGGLKLGTAIDEAITGVHENIDMSSVFFFKSPYKNGREQLDAALAADATVIFAVDILFWYVYINAGLDTRMASLEDGLRNLERASVPIILGDIPDMRTGQPWMLPPSVIPPPEHLETLNARVEEWALQRLNVHLVPLAEWSAALVADGELVIEEGKPPVPAKSLVHADGLHPNPQGVRYMLMQLGPSLVSGFPDTNANALTF